MNHIEKYKKRQRLFGQLLLAAGIICAAAGAALESAKITVGIDPRLITGLGILLLGLSLGAWLRLNSALKKPLDAMRLVAAESDERMTDIKSKAGQRGFWTALAITYALLMWESVASNGSLPALSANARWYWLAAAVVLPMTVYIAGIIQGNKAD
jgi:hypothetical protein